MNWILANKLKSRNFDTCLAAGRKIAKQQSDQVSRDVSKILESNSRELRSSGLFVAVAMKPHSGRRIVTKLLKDSDTAVRITTLKNLRELDAKDYGADVYVSFEDTEQIVVIEGMRTAISLNGDGSAQELSKLLDHPSAEIRKQAYILGADFWNYEHLKALKKCLSLANGAYSDELGLLISGIESRSASLAKALEKGSGRGNSGLVEKPKFRSGWARFEKKGEANNGAQSVKKDSLQQDNPNFGHQDGFEGTVREVELRDILQLACMSVRSQSYDIMTPHGLSEISICEGEIVHAKFGDEVGQDALFLILSSTKGRFKEIDYRQPEMRTIHAPWEFLLLESARIQDESEVFPFDLENI